MSDSERILPTDHAGMEVLDSTECLRLLGSVPVGRIAYVADGAPQIFPVTFRLVEDRIVFRSTVGSKLDSAEMGRHVAFEVDGWDPATRSGWSVVARGTLFDVTDAERIAALQTAGLEPWLDARAMRWIEVRVQELSGRRLPR